MKKNIYLGAVLAIGLLASCNKADEPQPLGMPEAQTQEGTFELNLTAGVSADAMRMLQFDIKSNAATGAKEYLEDFGTDPRINKNSDFTTHAFFRKKGLDEVGYAQITWQVVEEEDGRIVLKLPKTKITLENISDNTIDSGEEWYVAGIAGGGKLNDTKTGVSFEPDGSEEQPNALRAPIAFGWKRIYKDEMVRVHYYPQGVLLRTALAFDPGISGFTKTSFDFEFVSNELDYNGYFDYSVEANPINELELESQTRKPVWKFTNGSFGTPQEAKLKFTARGIRGWGARQTTLCWGMSRELPAGEARHSVTKEVVGAKMPLSIYRAGRFYPFKSEVALRNGLVQQVDVDVYSAEHPFDRFAPGYLTAEKTFDSSNPLLLKWQEMMDRFGKDGNDKVEGYQPIEWSDAVILLPQNGVAPLSWTQSKASSAVEHFTMANRYFGAKSEFVATGNHIVYALRFQPIADGEPEVAKLSKSATRVQDLYRRMAYRYTHNPADGSVKIEAIQVREDYADLTMDKVATEDWWTQNLSKAKTVVLASVPFTQANGNVMPANTFVSIWTRSNVRGITAYNLYSQPGGAAVYSSKPIGETGAILLIKEWDL